jgi:hypothetical protein
VLIDGTSFRVVKSAPTRVVVPSVTTSATPLLCAAYQG